MIKKLRNASLGNRSALAALVVAAIALIGTSYLVFGQAATPKSYGDLNNSGAVDAADLKQLLEDFGTATPESDVDSSGGLVNIIDLSTLLSNYGRDTTTPPPTPTSKLLGVNASKDPNATDSRVAAEANAQFRRADIDDLNITLAPGGPPVLAILYPNWKDANARDSETTKVVQFVERNASRLAGISIDNESGYAYGEKEYWRGGDYARFWQALMPKKTSMSATAKAVPFIMDFDSGGRGANNIAEPWAKQILAAGFPNPDMIELHAYGPNYMNKINDDAALLPSGWHGKIAITETGINTLYSGLNGSGSPMNPGKTYGDGPQPMTFQAGAQLLKSRVGTLLNDDRIKMVSVYSSNDTSGTTAGEDNHWGIAFNDGTHKPYMFDAFVALRSQIQ